MGLWAILSVTLHFKYFRWWPYLTVIKNVNKLEAWAVFTFYNLYFRFSMSQAYELSKVIKKNWQKNALRHHVFSMGANSNWPNGRHEMQVCVSLAVTAGPWSCHSWCLLCICRGWKIVTVHLLGRTKLLSMEARRVCVVSLSVPCPVCMSGWHLQRFTVER